jgi:hypothetical protein
MEHQDHGNQGNDGHQKSRAGASARRIQHNAQEEQRRDASNRPYAADVPQTIADRPTNGRETRNAQKRYDSNPGADADTEELGR